MASRPMTLQNEKLFFLKDSWRINLPDIHKEGEVYKIMNKANIANVLQCLVSGDISTDYHATKTNLYAGKPWNCRLIFG
jgi:hypothetical protein